MAASFVGILPDDISKSIQNAKIFVVGAGGIGCELLKNLVLTGFEDIELIDLDTIDVSNLNRQFLFRKEHVGKSKAQVAKESALKFNPNAKIVAHHDSIMSSEYGVQFFKGFTLVMNALDNRAARNHVNRICLAADVPLIESGSAGYLGQVTVIKKGVFECYECHPAAPQKSYPGCTIRNTPSEPIHCIVWAKHLFNQLFGEDDPDQDVSPDTEDPEAAGDAGQTAAESEAKQDSIGGIERKSTKAWAQEIDFNSTKIFHKLFRDDIKYLLSMENLWKKRRPPTPLDLTDLPDTEKPFDASVIEDQRTWSVRHCADVFHQSVGALKARLRQESDQVLVWDKDDKAAMDFVTCVANIRAFVFGIAQKSRFDIKSMAGNIIPAIATTNAIVAALIVMEGLKILQGRVQDCRTVVLNRQPNARKKLLDPGVIERPNPKCYVCSDKPEITVALNTTTLTVKTFEEKVLKQALGMVAPDVELDDGLGSIIISSEEGETDENLPKFLSDVGVVGGARLKCDDFLQEFKLNVNIAHVDKLFEDREFELVGDLAELQAKLENEKEEKQSNGKQSNGHSEKTDGASNCVAAEEDDLVVMADTEVDAPEVIAARKRKASLPIDVDAPPAEPAKKRRLEEAGEGEGVIEEGVIEEEVIVL